MSRPAIPAGEFEHGDARRYRRGCRCTKCRAGMNASNIRRKYLRDTGRSIHRPVEKARQHIVQLRAAGLTDAEIRQQANLSPDPLYRIMRGHGTIHLRTEQRILAVPVPAASEPTPCRAHVPELGTLRRLRALVADGWTAAELARRLDHRRENMHQLLRPRPTGSVTMTIADKVARLYADLHALAPEEHGVSRYYAERARALAAAQGWAPSAYWDDEDFDNPEFEPALPGSLRRNEQGAVRRAEVEHLASFGLGHEEIAARLSMSPSYVRDIVRELRTDRPRERTAA